MPVLPAKKRRVKALRLRECKAIVAEDGAHLVLLFRSGEHQHTFCLSLDDARTLAGGIEQALAKAEEN